MDHTLHQPQRTPKATSDRLERLEKRLLPTVSAGTGGTILEAEDIAGDVITITTAMVLQAEGLDILEDMEDTGTEVPDSVATKVIHSTSNIVYLYE